MKVVHAYAVQFLCVCIRRSSLAYDPLTLSAAGPWPISLHGVCLKRQRYVAKRDKAGQLHTPSSST